MPNAQQSSVGMQYAKREDYPSTNFDTLNPGDPVDGQTGKVWQHEFVESGGGGWFAADAPGAPVKSPSSTATPSSGAGGGGGDAMSAAMAGLKSAADPTQGYSEAAAPGGSDPNLGTRLMPILMAQLSQQGRRIY
jgi:hypothetical protein